MLFDPEDPFDHYLRVYALGSEVPGQRVNVITSSTWADVVAVSRALEDIGRLRESIVARNVQVVMFVYILDYALTH